MQIFRSFECETEFTPIKCNAMIRTMVITVAWRYPMISPAPTENMLATRIVLSTPLFTRSLYLRKKLSTNMKVFFSSYLPDTFYYEQLDILCWCFLCFVYRWWWQFLIANRIRSVVDRQIAIRKSSSRKNHLMFTT